MCPDFFFPRNHTCVYISFDFWLFGIIFVKSLEENSFSAAWSICISILLSVKHNLSGNLFFIFLIILYAIRPIFLELPVLKTMDFVMNMVCQIDPSASLCM